MDILIADLGLADSDGLATLQGLLDTAEHLPVVVLSAEDSDDLMYEAIWPWGA